jgi:RimJ/RimL family protein N-acetyltransferase
MAYTDEIKGKNIFLRPVNEDDAEFILSLRLNDRLNKFINKVSPSIEIQKSWINNQRIREGDYYFLILDKDKNAIGTISVYDINFENKTFNWGRWILKHNAPIYAMIESTLLVYHYAFRILELSKALSDVRLGNYKVINFHLSYGAKIYKIDEQNAYYTFESSQFKYLINRYKGFYNY